MSYESSLTHIWPRYRQVNFRTASFAIPFAEMLAAAMLIAASSDSDKDGAEKNNGSPRNMLDLTLVSSRTLNEEG
jgi:hypothetical protein